MGLPMKDQDIRSCIFDLLIMVIRGVFAYVALAQVIHRTKGQYHSLVIVSININHSHIVPRQLLGA